MLRRLLEALQDTDIFFFFFKRHRPALKIAGQCLKRGVCCKNLILGNGIRPIRNHRQFRRLLRRRPDYQMFIPHDEAPSDGYLRFRCKNLTVKDTCGIYESRPELCRRYPDPLMLRYGGSLLPGCGYKIVPKQGFEELLEKEQTRSSSS